MSLISKELNYETKSIEHGNYVISRITQQSNTAINLSASGGQTSVFEIPSNVVNFAKSYLSFTTTYGAAGGAALSNKIFSIGAPMIRSIQLTTREGLFLADLQQVNRMLSVVLPAEARGDEWGSNDVPQYSKFTASGINRNLGTDVNFNELIIPSIAYNADVRNTSQAYIGLQHIIVSAANTLAGGTVNWSLPMSIFKNSILAMNLDQYFGGQSIFLTITWDAQPYSGYIGTTIASDGLAILAGNVSISNLYFNLAVETNQVAQMVARSNKSYSIPYTYTSKIAFTAGGLQSTQVRYNRSQGSKLKKIYWAPFTTDETLSNAFNHSNATVRNAAGDADVAANTTSFYSLLNNQRLQQFNPVCANFEDYYLIRSKLKGTPIATSRSYYQLYVWIEDFTSGEVKVDDSFLTDGFSLEEDALYTMNCTATAAQTHQVFSVVERTLHLEDGRITLS